MQLTQNLHEFAHCKYQQLVLYKVIFFLSFTFHFPQLSLDIKTKTKHFGFLRGLKKLSVHIFDIEKWFKKLY